MQGLADLGTSMLGIRHFYQFPLHVMGYLMPNRAVSSQLRQ